MYESARRQGFGVAISSTAIGLRFRCWEIVSGTVDAPSNGSRTKQILQCAAKVANQFSIAGVLGINEESHPFLASISNAFLGNTFSGITDAVTHVATGQVGATAGDLALSGYSQGLPIGSGIYAKGIAGVATDAGVNAVNNPGVILSVTGAATELGEEGLAGPVGWAKLGIDRAIYASAVAYCTNHI